MRRITQEYLPNGVLVNCLGDKVSFVGGIGADVGGIDDQIGRTGQWHLIEHLISRQTRSFQPREMHLLLRKLAGWGEGQDSDLNVRVCKLSSFYGFDLLFSLNDAKALLRLLAEAYKDRYLTEGGLKSEKGAVHTETKVFGTDVIQDRLERAIIELIYETNPVRRRLDSEPAELKEIYHPTSLLRAINKFFVPRRTFINIFGPSHKDSMKLAYEIMGDWQPEHEKPLEVKDGKLVTPRPKRIVEGYDGSDNMPVIKGVRERTIELPGIEGHYLAIGMPTCLFGDPQSDALEWLSETIGFECFEAGRTQNTDFDSGLYRFFPVTYCSFTHGMLYFWTASASEEGIKRAEENLVKQCLKATREPVNEDVFESIRHRKLETYRGLFAGNASPLSEAVISHIVNGDWDLEKFHQTSQILKALTPRKLLKAGKRFFGEDGHLNYAKVIIRPLKN